MINYYEILGLSYGASISDVKASFRQLAKMYHPDLNPGGLEHFAKVLKAYETLSDPVLKQAYDYKLNYHQAQTLQQQSSKTSKTWTFTEKELKRRQYYDEHIRKYAKQTAASAKTAEVKTPYNEFKYILYATPLAVILFVIIMALAKKPNPTFQNPESGMVLETSKPPKRDRVHQGEDVYTALFGSSQYNNKTGRKLILRNETGKDAVVCFFNGKRFVRSFYIGGGDSGQITQLPGKHLSINFTNGTNFDTSNTLPHLQVKGLFTGDVAFFRSKKPLDLAHTNELILATNNDSFEQTTAAEFFKNKTAK